MDFIKGMDVSTLIEEEACGAKYYDHGEQGDMLEILKRYGCNSVRLRLWNDPYDENGNPYGAGTNDLEKTIVLSKRAKDLGMSVLLDYHYSDFWADPGKQYAPTEWARKSVDEKAGMIREYTRTSLDEILAAGADVAMVQIGNEINNGMCGCHDTADVMTLLQAASEIVRDVSASQEREISIAVHYTQVDDAAGTLRRAKELADYGIDYDIFGISYYPYWHGTMENMVNVLSEIKDTYGVDTCILETAYVYTAEDGDSFGNSVAGDDALEGYPATVQGQAKCIRDIMAAAKDAGALGVFYWEGAWVPVGSDYDTNKVLWETYGSGWASSYSVAYDPLDAGEYYGGCSWDNQAMFDFNGKVLPSLNVFKWVNYGATAPLEVIWYKDVYLECGMGEELTMPETVEVYYNDPSETGGVSAEWDMADVEAVDTRVAGVYTVNGTAQDGTSLSATVKVMNVNYVKNPGFDDVETSVWEVTDRGAGDATDIQTKAADALSGEKAFHFYSTSEIDFDLEQSVDGLPAGSFAAVANIQGGDVGSAANIYLYVEINGERYESEAAVLAGWQKWQVMQITDIPVEAGDSAVIGIHVSAQAKGWGTIDDVEFYNQIFE